MNKVTVRKQALLEKLEENRKAHRAIFEQAQGEYRRQIIETLEERLENARKGRSVEKFIQLPEPEDHTEDYNQIIEMVHMHVEDEIELSNTDFGRYVMDRWEWKQSWSANTLSYTQPPR